MKMNFDFFSSPTGQVVLVAGVLVLGVVTVRMQHAKRTPAPLPEAKPALAVPLPKVLTREGRKFTPPPAPAPEPKASVAGPAPVTVAPQPAKADVIGLSVADVAVTPLRESDAPAAPYGRLVPCETVVALESNQLDTPVIGLVTEDVWHAGRVVVPAGAEVHAKAALDRTRERIAVTGPWRIVWRTGDADNGAELTVEGLALDREFEGGAGVWGEHDGSAGLRGTVVKTDNARDLRLFASSFLAAATVALQDSRSTPGPIGEAVVSAPTARNAALAGSAAVLRDYANTMKEAIARDGFYLRVPAGKPFYLYVTQTIDRTQATRLLAGKPKHL